MANHKSSEKRARQTIKRTARNTSQKSAVKTTEKKLTAAITAKSKKEVPELLKAYVAAAMSSVTKGVLKKETVSRKIGRISARAHKALTATK